MNCSGRSVLDGDAIEVGFGRVIQTADPLLSAGLSTHDWIAPGFIDLQVNGFAGVDYNSPTASQEDIGRSLSALFSTGVSRCFPTVITGAPERMLAALSNLARAREQLEHGEAMEAFHVEGPHISPEDGPRGAHPAQWVRPPDLDEFQRWQDAAQGNIRLVTLSPEWPGAVPYIEALRGHGVVTSLGHTRATEAQILDAVSAGATLSTHLGNGAHSTLPKTENYIWTQLAETRLAASLIVDGHHLPQAFLQAALRAKGTDRCILITDAVAPAMCPPGEYMLGEVPVERLEDGRVVLRSGSRLAGSTLKMDQAIANVMRWAGVPLAEAVTMASTNAARVGRVAGRLRGLQPGERADLVRFQIQDGVLRVLETYLSGARVFSGSVLPAP
jgi:N-acetylglucosamine-6-phosphate deacetylase